MGKKNSRAPGGKRPVRRGRRGGKAAAGWKRIGVACARAIVRFVYTTGLVVLNLWDRFVAAGGVMPLLRAIGRGAAALGIALWAGLCALGRRLAALWDRFSRWRAVRRQERRRYSLKVRALAMLTGEKRGDITLPYTEEEKSRAIHAATRRVTIVVTPILAALMILLIIYTAKSYVLGVHVWLDGKEIGCLESEEQFSEVVSGVESYIARVTGESYTVEAEPQFKTAMMKREDIQTAPVEQVLYNRATDVISESYGLYVEDALIAVNMNGQGIRDEMQKLLDKAATGGENERVEFVQKVDVRKGMMPKNMEKSLIEIADLLTQTAVKEQTYTVKAGDTLSEIAENFGMSLASLQGLNPDVNPTTMREGTVLTVQASAPLLSVKIVKTITYEESIPYETERISTDSLYQGQSKVKVAGQKGVVSIEADVTYINGVETERAELSRTVIQEPVTRQLLVGTKKLPAKSATGVMRRPVGGIISSPYGKKRGSSVHTGVDFAVASGTPIVAADGGKVVSAGWAGSYGYCVVINHENGLKTRYAHCSKLLVTAGERVAKGQTIARVGSTGNSTGPHLHFEVIKNGQFVNPFNYI